jgi:hypothetical protein
MSYCKVTQLDIITPHLGVEGGVRFVIGTLPLPLAPRSYHRNWGFLAMCATHCFILSFSCLGDFE